MVASIVAMVVSLLSNRDAFTADSLVTGVSRLLRCDAARLISEENGIRTTVARFPAATGMDRFPERAIEWAARGNSTVLMHEIDWKSNDDSAGSLERNSVASVLCVRLVKGASALGYLYLDRLRNSPDFTEQDRSLCDTLSPLFTELIINGRERTAQAGTISRLQELSRDSAGGIIFDSAPMRRVIELAARISRTDTPVLVTGETGTGKERMARFIHDSSNRGKNPFRAINCGAIPETLMEAELFGHEKGAFTGASSAKDGIFKAASGGTLLLDEIGDLPLHMQVKLLRALQEGEILPVGATNPVRVDVRIIAATNRKLDREISAGRFRQDLFFRLNVLTIELPPLREREGDVILLAEHFLRRYSAQFGIQESSFSPSSRDALAAYDWPGNIRELENVIQKALIACPSGRIERAHLEITGRHFAGSGGITRSLRDVRADAERDAIERALRVTGGNITHTAELLQIDRKWVMKKMEELGLSIQTYRQR
jgi:DNA-binding NtrC family response regulator